MDDTLVTAVQQETDNPDESTDADSAATRHLCAGVYVDRPFRDLIIRKVHNDARHRVAPSYGCDLVPVVRHAWRAWLLDTGQLVAMLGTLLAGLLVGGPLATVLVLCAVVFCRLLRGITRELPEVFQGFTRALVERFGFSTESRDRPSDQRSRKRRLKAMLTLLLVTMVVPVGVAFLLGRSLAAAVLAAAMTGAGLVVCAIVVGIIRQLLLNAVASAGTTRPHTLTNREKTIDEQQNHPCVIYRRPPHREDDLDPLALLTRTDTPSPFVGSGKLVNRWLPPLTIQLLRPGDGTMEEREYTTPPFTAHELVEALRIALTKLGADPGEENLPDLRVHDRIYIAATDFPANGNLTRSDWGKDEIWKIIDNHSLPRHHFLETSVPIFGGELVATVLIRVSLKGRSLSLDVATCALTRTPEAFHVIYRYGEKGWKGMLRSMARLSLAVPVDVMRTWRLIKAPVVVVGAWRAQRDPTSAPRRRSVAPKMAVREEIADSWDNAQLDRSTISDHMKIVEKRILKAVEDFLRAHGVDTSMFDKQATNIVNSGVLNMGGSQMTVDQLAAGVNAQVINNKHSGDGGQGGGS